MKKPNPAAQKAGFKARMRYRFDNIMAKGTISLVMLLFAITFLVVVAAGILVVLLDPAAGAHIGGSVWVSLMHAIDAGTLTADSGSFSFMLLMSLVTLCGLFVTSVLIGIINTGMEARMDTLRKGKSKVLESGHTLILGFGSGVYTFLEQLVSSGANEKDSIVVVLDEAMQKEEMEDAIRQRIPHCGHCRIICRNGCISDLADLEVCSPEYAKSIIINTQDDFTTIQAILAVTALLKQAGNTDTYITAVIRGQGNRQAAEIAGEGRAEILYFEDTVARIIANTCRQPGFAAMFTELIGFEGSEIYLEEVPAAAGLSMGEINLHFPRSTVLGVESGGSLTLAPENSRVIRPGDRLILLAEDNGVSIPGKKGSINESHICHTPDNTPKPRQKMLVLGFSPRVAAILQQEDRHMAEGSQILLAVQEQDGGEALALQHCGFDNIGLQVRGCDIFDREVLSDLLDWGPDAVLVPSSLKDSPRRDDSRTLMLLLQLRSLAQEKHLKHTVTSEMRMIENQKLARITEVRDYVISSNITNLMLTQISQTRQRRRIFDELLSEDGAELHLHPASDYVVNDTPVSMYTCTAAAARKGQIFAGYRTESPEGDIAVVNNPPKNHTHSFGIEDCFIVLSQN